MEQLQLPLNIHTVEPSRVAHDPYWDEITKIEPNTNNSSFAPEHDNSVRAQNSLVEHPYKSVREQVTCDTAPEHQYFAPEHTHWVEKYWIKRGNTKHYYYRYCWMEGRKIHHCHIRGGHAGSAIAIERKKAVEEAIVSDCSPEEIIKLIAASPIP